MKKVWLLLPALLAGLALGACNKKPAESETSAGPETTESSESTEEGPSRVYYVVGGFNSWTTGEEWIMTADPEDSTHFTFEGLELAEGVGVKCTDSDGNWYPGGMGNDTVAPEDGIYKVDLYTFEEEDKMTQLTKTGDWVAPETSYFLVGSFNGWTAGDENYLMSVDAEDADLYVFNDLSLTANEELKVVDSNGSWYGDEGGNNIALAAGLYRVTFRVSTHAIECFAAN